MKNKKKASSVYYKVLYNAFLEMLGIEETDDLFLKLGNLPNDSSKDEQSQSWISIEKIGDLLAEKYQTDAAKGLLVRVGRASLNLLRRYEVDSSTLGAIENRLKPVGERFIYSLKKLADSISKNHKIKIEIKKTGSTQYSWQISKLAGNKFKIRYLPFYYFGLLEEFCQWLDARKNYQMIYGADTEKKGFDEIIIEINDLQ